MVSLKLLLWRLNKKTNIIFSGSGNSCGNITLIILITISIVLQVENIKNAVNFATLNCLNFKIINNFFQKIYCLRYFDNCEREKDQIRHSIENIQFLEIVLDFLKIIFEFERIYRLCNNRRVSE